MRRLIPEVLEQFPRDAVFSTIHEQDECRPDIGEMPDLAADAEISAAVPDSGAIRRFFEM
jgi:hypothetical protein